MTSRYLRLRAEQVTTTPWWGLAADEALGESRATAASRRAMSQSHRSLSVRGMPLAIFIRLDSEWYCWENKGPLAASDRNGEEGKVWIWTHVVAFNVWYGERLAEVGGHRAFPASCRTRDDPHVTVMLLLLLLLVLLLQHWEVGRVKLVVPIHVRAIHGRVGQWHGRQR